MNMLLPTDIPNPAPPAGQRREDTLPISRRVSHRVKQFKAWHDSIERACDQVFVDMCLIALWSLGPILIVLAVFG